MNVHIVIGTRPQYIKLAALRGQLAKDFDLTVIDTGQHYDRKMSEIFLDDLDLPKPDINLEVGSGGHGAVTGKIMERLEKVWTKDKPQLVIVVGDTNSCLAGALTAAKMEIPVAHVEAGLRSFEKNLPEEFNRVLTDHLSDILFITEPAAKKNLIREGISENKIIYAGNVMIDSLRSHLKTAEKRKAWERYGLTPGSYGVVTLHRPGNVDSIEKLDEILHSISKAAGNLPLMFPAHLRTERNLNKLNMPKGIKKIPPLGYLDFIGLMSGCRLMITDSGGVQEETSWLGIPCVTLRDTTERPITVNRGTNILAGTGRQAIMSAVAMAKRNGIVKSKIPKWDGKSAERILSELKKWARERNIYE